MYWWKRAAEKGDTDAQVSLAQSYEFGRGVPQDYSQAFTWYQKASKGTNSQASMGLAEMYHEGLGVPRDPSRAFALYADLARRGENGAPAQLAAMYEHGDGVSKDLLVACAWYEVIGEPTTSEKQALEDWIELIANPEAAERMRSVIAGLEQRDKESRERVCTQLTHEEAEKARSMASAWKPGQLIMDGKDGVAR